MLSASVHIRGSRSAHAHRAQSTDCVGRVDTIYLPISCLGISSAYLWIFALLCVHAATHFCIYILHLPASGVPRRRPPRICGARQAEQRVSTNVKLPCAARVPARADSWTWPERARGFMDSRHEMEKTRREIYASSIPVVHKRQTVSVVSLGFGCGSCCVRGPAVHVARVCR